MTFKLIRSALWCLAVFALFCSALQADEAPVLLWGSAPVKPGETVLLHGGNFGTSPRIELATPTGSRVVEPVSRSDSALMFTYPEDLTPSELRVRVVSDNGMSGYYALNAPDVWWTQGDWGDEASPGGWVRLFGRSIESPAGTPREFFLVGEDGAARPGIKSQEEVNRWSQRVFLADDIAEGVYRLAWIDDVTGETVTAAPFTVRAHQDVWKTDVFNIVDYGAVPNDGKDDTEAILKAADAVKVNGGGVLFVPRGRFCMTKSILLPPHSALRGVSQELSQIYWPDTDEPPLALVRGDHSFGVEDIFLTSGFHLGGIADDLKPEEYGAETQLPKGNITIRRLTMRLLYGEYVNSQLDKAQARLAVLHYQRALRLGGKFVRVVDSDIYAEASGAFEIDAEWAEFARNRVCRGTIIGWNGFRGSQLIFEDNHFGGANCTSFYGVPQMSENVYWGKNYNENTFDGNNRETLTGDCRTHFFLGRAAVNGSEISFDEDRIEDQTVDTWKRGVVQAAANHGVGQWRRVKNIEKKDGKFVVTVDRPWDIQPDETTVFYIGTCRGRFIYTENEVYDSTIALQLYGSMMEAVIADNITSRTGGYHADTMNGEVSWFIEMMNNTIKSGTAYRGPWNEVPARDAHIALSSNGYGFGPDDYSLLHSSLIRNCALLGNAYLEVAGPVADAVLEFNRVSDADLGERISGSSENIYQRGNVFQNVDKVMEKTER